jgi:hypothetical protein
LDWLQAVVFALMSHRYPPLEYSADQVTGLVSIVIKQGYPSPGNIFACRCAFRTAIASALEYIGPEGVGVAVGVDAQANAISTTMDSRTCTIRASDMEDR